MDSPNTACAAPTAATYIQYWLSDSPTPAPITTTASRASRDGVLTRLRPDITAPPPDHDDDDDHERDRLVVPAKRGRRQDDRLDHADGDAPDRGDHHVLQQPEQGRAERERDQV